MSQAQDNFAQLIRVLGYEGSDGLVADEHSTTSGTRSYLFQRARNTLGVQAIHFAGDTPIVYFSQRSRFDPTDVCNLHRKVWNDARVPLLFVVTPSEFRLYDAFAEPTTDAALVDKGNRLIECVSRATDIVTTLSTYSRIQVETGEAFPRTGTRFDLKNRCDQTLLRNLAETRRLLTTADSPLSDDVTHALIIRAILVLYLEHRKVLTPETYSEHSRNARSFADLLGSKKALYSLFADLARKFNGDLLPVSREEFATVGERHLTLLQRFISGEEIRSGQRSLWPLYDFAVIPIQFISAVYQLFLNENTASARSDDDDDDDDDGESESTGRYYTPPALAEILLDEVMPWPERGHADQMEREPRVREPRVLDPACGSGIFLVEAYRRLVERWRYANAGARVPVSVLRGILTRCIFGADIDGRAIRVAAFSLYLAMLDYIEPKSIWSQVRFPALFGDDGEDANLCCGDSFDKSLSFHSRDYDIIVGNPPWRRKPLRTGDEFCIAHRFTVVGEYAVPFLWLAHLRAPAGLVAMLFPSKLLFNREGPDTEFRRRFFSENNVHAVINLSALRKDNLFAATGPATAIIFSPNQAERSSSILYCTPKPLHNGTFSLALLLEGSEMKWLPRGDAERHDDIWKTMTWGRGRDLALVRQLKRTPSLKEYIEARGWPRARGFQDANARTSIVDDWLADLPHLPARNVERYSVPRAALVRCYSQNTFSRTPEPRIFLKPHVVVKEGQANSLFCASYVDRDCSFKDTITGIGGPPEDAPLLKALTCYLNSPLVSYILFHTSSTWGVERPRVKIGEMLSVPAFLPSEAADVARLADLWTRRATASVDEWEAVEQEIASVFFDIAHLSKDDRALVDDTLKHTIPFSQRQAGKYGPKRTTEGQLHSYAEVFARTIGRWLNPNAGAISFETYDCEGPLTAVGFSLSESKRVGVRPGVSRAHLEELFRRLESQLTSQESQSLYVRRHLRIFSGDWLYVIKPTQLRYWTRSVALDDADGSIVELLAGAQTQ